MIVTNKAPDFTAAAVLADGQIVEDFNLAYEINGLHSMYGLHLRDEAICKYFRLISRGETGDIPQIVIDAITGNEPLFLVEGFRGFMSQYKCIKNMGSAL